MVLVYSSYFLLLDKPPSVQFGMRAHFEKEPEETDQLLPPEDSDGSDAENPEMDEAINDPDAPGRYTQLVVYLKQMSSKLLDQNINFK